MIPKFRAWDKENRQMCNVGALYSSRDYEIELVSVHLHSGLVINRNLGNCILMQSTGLIDRNGVEIFEGDIVSIEDHPFQKTKDSVVGVQIDGNYEIGWNDHDMTWCAGSLLLARLKPYVAVVGNIYE